MAKDTYLYRYSLILKRLEKASATFEQIKKYLEIESEIKGKNYSVSLRSFQRDIKDINEQFGIEIANERKGDKRYFIKSIPDSPEHSQRLLEAFQMLNAIKASKDNTEYILLETRKPDGLEHFYGLLHAIKNNKVVKLAYRKFYSDEITERKLLPLALKEAKNRWYLIAEDTKDSQVKTFGLDRISDLEITKLGFPKKINVNYNDLFKHSFGIINPADQKPEKVKLSFSFTQGQYIKSFPLHKSQAILSESKENDEVIIELFIQITDDFVMELLSYGSDVEVLSPKSLRKEIKKNLLNTLRYYAE
jgi:predicted DNA-binding transcriptional regulator YafY